MNLLLRILLPLIALQAVAGEADRTAEGYRLPVPNHTFTFPRDHGSHPEFKIEWWYITGHLQAEGRDSDFGFQATFFRYALAPGNTEDTAASFGTNQLYMAHMAVVDPANKRFLHEERLNREGWDASAGIDDLDLRNGNWSLVRQPDGSMKLKGSVRGQASFELVLAPEKPLVVFGKDGLSRKGAERSAASWYLTFPRIKTTGTLRLDGRALPVRGEAWMDHEISSSQLAEDQDGWDWASLRMDDGREIMVYILRKEDGSPDPHSTLAWVDRDGTLTHQGPDVFSWTARKTWTSRETGGTYPIDIDLRTVDPSTGKEVTFRLHPLMDAQEMVGHLGGVSYWEGACEILDPEGKRIGQSYVELTGYAGSAREALR